MKGFVSTLIAIALGLLLATFIAILQSSQDEFEINQLRYQSLANARTAFEEAAEDLHDIVGTDIHLQENDAALFIRFQDTFPPANLSDALDRYAIFLQTSASANRHANMSLNVTSLSDGRAEILFFEDQFVYWKDYAANRTVASPLSGGSSAYNYSGNLTVPLVRASLDQSGLTWVVNASDGTYIDIDYSDSNGSLGWAGYIDPTRLQRIRILYDNNQTLDVYFGAMDLFEANSSFNLDTPGFVLEGSAPATFSIIATRPPLTPNQKWGARYNTWFTYRQDNTTKSGYVVRTG